MTFHECDQNFYITQGTRKAPVRKTARGYHVALPALTVRCQWTEFGLLGFSIGVLNGLFLFGLREFIPEVATPGSNVSNNFLFIEGGDEDGIFDSADLSDSDEYD